MRSSSGPAPPSEQQIATLHELCDQTGQRFSRPRTSKQAAAQIKDLTIRARNGVNNLPPRQRTPRNADTEVNRLLEAIRREHYSLAKAIGTISRNHADDWAARIERMEQQVDQLMEAN